MPTDRTTIAVFAVKIVRDEMIAKQVQKQLPLLALPIHIAQDKAYDKLRIQIINNIQKSYHCTKVLSDVLKVFFYVQVESN